MDRNDIGIHWLRRVDAVVHFFIAVEYNFLVVHSMAFLLWINSKIIQLWIIKYLMLS